MSKKIGQALIEKGVLTQQQLETALQSQLIHGGQLGTSLIELGYTDETTLGRTLAEIQGLPHAPAEMFEDIPPAILETVPAEIVRTRRVVPIGLENRSLHLAVVNPKNLSNVSSATGFRIVPYLAAEARILQAMERYYDIARPPRYVRLDYRDAKRAAPGSARVLSFGRSRPTRVVHSVTPAPPEIEALCRKMSCVMSHSDLGQALLDFTLQCSDRVLLFDVSGSDAVVANWKGIDLDQRRMAEVKIPVTPDSLFALIMEDSYYRGPVPTDFPRESFYGELGMQVPQEILILPIYCDDCLEAVIYADGGPDGRVEGSADVYPLLLDRIGTAMKVLTLRRQLCPREPASVA